ncbi:MAG: hypothetical protein HZB53_01570 [Chloroflexi bacterium]|nr:hypothetical protein [Chloroflexota bacterium]
MIEFVIYQDEADLYRWRLVTAQGKTLAVAAEGCTREADLRSQLDLLRHQVRVARARRENRMIEAEIPQI